MNKLNLILALIIVCFSTACIRNNFKEYDINRLNTPLNDTLHYEVNEPTKLEIIIEGNIDGEAILEFENGANRFKQIKVKGKVNQSYKSEWYEPKCHFKYRPLTAINGGSLKLKYKIY